MADSKISALSDGTAPQSTDLFVVARGAGDNKLSWSELLASMPGYEYDYVQITANVTPTATTSATANSIIDGNSVTYDGSTRIKIEVFCPAYGDSGASFNGIINLYDGITELGVLAQLDSVSGGFISPIYGCRFLTPSSGAHTYHIKGWKGSGAPVFRANNGAAGNYMPAWYRITKA